MPRRLAVRMIRRAISPRLAMSNESIMGTFLLPVLSVLSAGAFQRAGGGLAKQGGAAPAIDLTTEERRGVHQAESRVGEHPRLSSIELGAQGRQHADPLLHVETLEAADLAARLLRQPVELVQVERDDRGVLQGELDMEVDQVAQRGPGVVEMAGDPVPAAVQQALADRDQRSH